MKNGYPPLHQTSTSKLANILLSFFPPLTENGYTVTNSFLFSEEVCKQDPNLYMASRDVDSLYTDITLDKTISICIYSLHND